MKNTDLSAQSEKKQNRFVFACVANILYIIPCLSCLAMGILLDGFGGSFVFAIVTMVLNLPASLIFLNMYKKKKGRMTCTVISAVIMLLHIVSIFFIGTWYLIMAPSFLLYCLIIAWSDVVENH